MSEAMNEISLDVRKALRAEKAGYLSEVTKALVAVNSGGAIAILAFIGTLAKEPALLQNFKVFGFYAFVCFALGIVAALFAPISLVEHVEAVRLKSDKARLWFRVCAAFFGVSFGGVALGLITVAFGVSSAF
ncbi:hypothetical protein [Janthinobacterium sp. 1_2014MBL_MicDiv]|uniref:hypothetical protein n=1 Tax=Janthinobacterium sp. 1_2014MBL_MicDiv TaxID=1644131 RepID=UPI0008F4C229|nr:hypothetical protein [Janthinobacterium sp. 1_2014MBL_MicDiv]APA66620.1 hypothetical protein YQ44_00955 [Janthinobacterium sp. 1_2014MBL_MicDiv]